MQRDGHAFKSSAFVFQGSILVESCEDPWSGQSHRDLAVRRAERETFLHFIDLLLCETWASAISSLDVFQLRNGGAADWVDLVHPHITSTCRCIQRQVLRFLEAQPLLFDRFEDCLVSKVVSFGFIANYFVLVDEK